MYLRVDNSARFTEERIKLEDEELQEYDIVYETSKVCNGEPIIEGSQICTNCYYRDFFEKWYDTRKSKRSDFLDYQMSVREDPERFLLELEDIVIDNEGVLEEKSYLFPREVKDYIKDAQIGHGFKGEKSSSSLSLTELIANKVSVAMLNNSPIDISEGLKRFREDHPSDIKTAFLIMQFTDTDIHDEMVATIRSVLSENDVTVLRADDKEYVDDLFGNIKTYMHGCDFGIAIFERITGNEFNPNVSFEVGYMMGLNKPVCLLKDQTLANLHTDLAGKLYKPFNTYKIRATLEPVLEKWLADKDLKKNDPDIVV